MSWCATFSPFAELGRIDHRRLLGIDVIQLGQIVSSIYCDRCSKVVRLLSVAVEASLGFLG